MFVITARSSYTGVARVDCGTDCCENSQRGHFPQTNLILLLLYRNIDQYKEFLCNDVRAIGFEITLIDDEFLLDRLHSLREHIAVTRLSAKL